MSPLIADDRGFKQPSLVFWEKFIPRISSSSTCVIQSYGQVRLGGTEFMLLLTGIEPDYLETPDGDLADCATTDGKFEFKTQVPRPSSLVFPLFIFELNFMSPGTKFQNNFASTTDIFNRGHKNY